ncbi:epidermal growth factor receptor kinase substrate 8-like isoform X2 [Bradysia coprophila]|nr:epidermal growth factor receptor kinase substrate 8-like isoform X2 [Bradysia coprophila]XP_037025328.1 epidermal growth factor receptor kinase substrate 8-like isoform X2 [Bradysia coprophila]
MAYHRPAEGNYSEDEFESRVGSDLDSKPTYLLEHLATFTVNKDSGIVYPADGMNRLLQLEKTTGIWSQKMQLCLDRQWILIVDYETGKVIERFPATLIQEPTAFTSDAPLDMYNNVLVFIVGGGSGARSEMHIFQCQSISAVQIVEDLKMLRSGKLVSQHREPNTAVTKKPSNTESYHQYTQDSDFETNAPLNDETSSTSSDRYEKDVFVLNHCFDDIEKFIARLQHTAAAARELERRIYNRKSKKRDPGEGLLTLRTRPPHEKEFMDIFSKFKLSFNLLAKLKAHIHDPNAPELVHFLFTPLALIVDASHDTEYDVKIPERVIDPLLTREAINLLINCVTSKETELWRSLGEAWTVPRDQWKGHVGAYHPVFFDGWSPDFSMVDESDGIRIITPPKLTRHAEPPQFSTEYEYDPKYNPPASPGFRDFSVRSDISNDSIERTNATHDQSSTLGWLEDIQSRHGKIAQVTYPRTANNDKELSVVRGEFIEILDDTRKWWKVRNILGQIGHVPHTIVTLYDYNDQHAVLYNSNKAGNYGRSRSSSKIHS